MTGMFYGIFLYFILPALLIKLLIKSTYKKCSSKVCLVAKVAIVTGGNKGIGFQTSLGLASRGCKVIIACRSNAENEVKQIIEMTRNPQISHKYLDLAAYSSVRKFSEEIHKEEEKIDILINNAGINNVHQKYTEDKVHMGMQVNLFSGVLLTHLLVDLLKKSERARVIFLSSITVYTSFLKLEELNFPENSPQTLKNATRSYSNSKLGQALVAVELAERLKKFNINVNAVNPGSVRTAIYDDLHELDLNCYEVLIHWAFKYFVYYYLRTPEEGAQMTLKYAMSNSCKDVTGYVDTGYNWILSVPRCIHDKEFRRRVFEAIEEFAQIKESEKIPK